MERRDFELEELEVRDDEDGGQVIRGMAIPFNRSSQDLGGFIERIDPGAVEVDGTDVVMLWQQDTKPVRRTLKKIELREISPVTWPAYKQTSVKVAVRSALDAGIELDSEPEVVAEDTSGADALRRLKLLSVDL